MVEYLDKLMADQRVDRLVEWMAGLWELPGAGYSVE